MPNKRAGPERLTPCMPCSFVLLPHSRSEAGGQPIGPLRVTVVVRWIPLLSAAYGTRVAAGENYEARTWRRRLPARPEGEARPRVTTVSGASREGGAAARE